MHRFFQKKVPPPIGSFEPKLQNQYLPKICIFKVMLDQTDLTEFN